MSGDPHGLIAAAFDGMAANLAVVDSQGVIIIENQAWRDYAAQNGGSSTLGMNYLRVCQNATAQDGQPDPEARKAEQGIRAVLDGTQRFFEMDYPCAMPDGIHYFLLQVTSLKFGEHVYAVLTHQDITGLKTKQLRVQDRNVALQDFITQQQTTLQDQETLLSRRERELAAFRFAGSHDLQEPLRQIRIYADRIRLLSQKDEPPREKLFGFAKGIESEAARASHLVSGILTVTSFIEPERHEQVDLAALAAKLLPPEVEFRTTGHFQDVYGDPKQLNYLIGELFANSQKFKGECPLAVEFKCSRPSAAGSGGQEADLHFQFSDNGLGVESQYQQKVFELFRRLYRREVIPGEGIGLAAARWIVEGHGGHIWMTSNAPAGVAVHFTLPAALGNK